MGRKLKLNLKGFKDIRTSPKVRDELLKRARRVSSAAGGEGMGFKVTELVLERNRAAVSVMATARNSRMHHALIRALDAGVYDHVLDETRLTVDVWAVSSPRASELGRMIYALLRAWPGVEPGVYRRDGWSRPAYFPDSDTRNPRYVLTAMFSFRGEAVDLIPL